MMTESEKQLVSKVMREQGLFVACGKNPPNLMSTHWGAIGNFWNRDVFILPVRYNKLSHDIIDQTKEFSVSVPLKDLREAIFRVDHTSGREHNKFEELHLHPSRARNINTYIVNDCGLFLDCKVLYSGGMEINSLDLGLKNEMYSNKNFHTMYFAEIIECYKK